MERKTSGRAELISFLASAKQNGIADSTVIGVLKTNGWAESDIYAGMRDLLEEQTGVAVPLRRGLAGGARDAFLYLLHFGTLSAWIVALGSIFFGAIEHFWPDPVMSVRHTEGAGFAESLQLAAVIVGYPIFMLTARLIAATLRQDPDAVESPIRKWLTYFALLIAATVVIGDLITFLAFLLRGEISTRFALKVVVVLALAAGVFVYYVSGLRGPVNQRLYSIVASVAALAGLAVGFLLLGSPAQQRAIGADRVRVGHLRGLAWELKANPGQLPVSIGELRSPHIDPVTGVPYEYRVVDGSRYEICATFSGEVEAGFWGHRAGRQCFTLDASQPVP